MRLLPALALLLALVLAAPAAAAEPVTIYRDGAGVPHIEATTPRGTAYATGYAQAKDRLFLTAAIRLTAQGRTAELLGPGALPADIATRRDFYDADDVQRQFDALPVGIQQQLQAFSGGFNRGMAETLADPRRHPAAFAALGYVPEPWKPTDSVSVVGLFTWISFAGEGGAGQLRNASLLGRLVDRFGEEQGLDLWDDLLFKNDPAAPTVAGPGAYDREPEPLRHERRPGPEQRALALELARPLQQAAERREAEARAVQDVLAKLPVPRIGSYAAAVAGERTRSGGALLFGAPQSGLSAPSVFWQIGQHEPGRDCTGMTVPGLGPWTAIGWCNDHAWSLVAGNMGEQVDHYIERVNPDDPRQYRHEGVWKQMRVRRETFKVGKCHPPICSTTSAPDTRVVEFEDTVHGPVVQRDAARGIAITQRRAQRGHWARALVALDGWNRAKDMAEFDRFATLAPATYNMVYGDKAGNIGYRFSGWQPVRAKGFDRRLPMPGTGEAEWQRFLRPDEMPRSVNPPSGIVMANQGVESKPAPWWPNTSSVAVGQVTRVGFNRRQLDREDLDVPAAEALNPALLERADGITPFLAGHLRAALQDADDPRLREAWGLFREWEEAGFPRVDEDGDGNYDHPAVMLFGADHFNLKGDQHPRFLWGELLARVFEDELGAPEGNEDRGTFQVPGGGFARMSLLKLALDGRDASRPLSRDFVDDLRTPGRETATQLIRASLAKALTQLEARFRTPDMRRWLGPVPVMRFGALGLVEPPPIRGFDHGTYSQIVDPKAGVGRYVLPPGNGSADGAPEIAAAQLGQYPKHFVDQRELYEDYGHLDMPRFPAQFRAGEAQTVLVP
jgi:penicillin G amidase